MLPGVSLPISLRRLLDAFGGCFTAPTFEVFSALRLVQESVTNARRHAAGAHEIAVVVRTEGGIAQVLVRDDGRPAREPKTFGGGYGLVGMRERVQLLGGRFSAGRAPSGGWQVAADVPLRDPEQ